MKTEFACGCGARWSASVDGDAVPAVQQEARTTITGPDQKEYPVKNEQGLTLVRFEMEKGKGYSPVYQ